MCGLLRKKLFFFFVIILIFILVLFGLKLKVLFESNGEDFSHPLINKNVQDIRFYTLEKKQREHLVTIKELLEKGSHWVILHFWTAHCSSCKAEIPEINSFYESLNMSTLMLKFYSCNLYNSYDEIKALQKSHHIKYPILYTRSYNASLEFGIIGTPATYLISPEGQIKWYGSGPLNSKKIINIFKKESH